MNTYRYENLMWIRVGGCATYDLGVYCQLSALSKAEKNPLFLGKPHVPTLLHWRLLKMAGPCRILA